MSRQFRPELKEAEEQQIKLSRAAPETAKDEIAVEIKAASDPIRKGSAQRPIRRTEEANNEAFSDREDLRSEALSDQELVEIAMDPHSSEESWIDACTLLGQRQQEKPRLQQRPRIPYKFLAAIAVVSILVSSCIFAVAAWHSSPANTITDQQKPSTYIQLHAHWQNEKIRERETVHLAIALERLGWSVEKAAKVFGVASDPMADLMNGRRKHHFSIDELNKMLFALGEVPTFPNKITEQENKDAVEHYSRAIRLNPQNSHAYWRRAFAYDRLGKEELALADLSYSMDLNHNPCWQLEKRADIYLRAKKYDLALRDANEMIARFPNENGEEVRAEIWNAMEKYDKALIDNNTTIAKMQIPSPDPYYSRAEIYKRLGMYKEAICDLEKVLEIDPNNSDASEEISKLKS